MNIVIAGKNNIAIEIVKFILSNYNHHNVFSIHNDNDSGSDGFQKSYKKFCIDNGIKNIELYDVNNLDDIVFFSLEFDKIININHFRTDKIYNIHFSLLPKYKGMYTSAWPIINNETETGVTLHKIDSGIDTGDIIDQTKIRIDDNETAKTLYEKYIYYGIQLVKDNFDNCLSGAVNTKPQDPRKSSYYNKYSIDYSNLEFNLNKSAVEIKRKIDAFSFRDYQLPEVFSYKVFGCDLLSSRSNYKAGTIIEENRNYIIISTIDYDLKIYKDIFNEIIDSCKIGDLVFIKNNINKFLINEKNSEGLSPIMVAAANGNLDVIKYLVKIGGDINDQDYQEKTLLDYAIEFSLEHEKFDILIYLLKFGHMLSGVENLENILNCHVGNLY